MPRTLSPASRELTRWAAEISRDAEVVLVLAESAYDALAKTLTGHLMRPPLARVLAADGVAAS